MGEVGEKGRRQLMRLKGAIQENRLGWVNRHIKLIFQYDSAKPHISSVLKT